MQSPGWKKGSYARKQHGWWETGRKGGGCACSGGAGRALGKALEGMREATPEVRQTPDAPPVGRGQRQRCTCLPPPEQREFPEAWRINRGRETRQGAHSWGRLGLLCAPGGASEASTSAVQFRCLLNVTLQLDRTRGPRRIRVQNSEAYREPEQEAQQQDGRLLRVLVGIKGLGCRKWGLSLRDKEAEERKEFIFWLT